jgi:hypothetical protein
MEFNLEFKGLMVFNFTEYSLCHEFNQRLYVPRTVHLLTASILPSKSYMQFSSRFISSSLHYMPTLFRILLQTEKLLKKLILLLNMLALVQIKLIIL